MKITRPPSKKIIVTYQKQPGYQFFVILKHVEDNLWAIKDHEQE